MRRRRSPNLDRLGEEFKCAPHGGNLLHLVTRRVLRKLLPLTLAKTASLMFTSPAFPLERTQALFPQGEIP